jgi:hypothetical protein
MSGKEIDLESSFRDRYDVARQTSLGGFMVGVHFVPDKSFDLDLDIPLANHIATMLDARNGKTITKNLSQEICVFNGIDSKAIEKRPLEMVILESQAEVHYFREFKENELNKYKLLGLFNAGKAFTASLIYPVQRANKDKESYPLAFRYGLHNKEIEVYFMGGTKKLKELQVEARKEILSMAQELYNKVNSNVELEIKEDKRLFRLNENEVYQSGSLKTRVYPKHCDLPLDALD